MRNIIITTGIKEGSREKSRWDILVMITGQGDRLPKEMIILTLSDWDKICPEYQRRGGR